MSDGGSLPPHRRSRDGVATPALAISALLLALVAMAPIIALVASLWLHPVAAADDDKVVICHNTGNGHKTIEVAPSAVDSHLSHGDTLGPCDDSTPTPSPTVSPTASPTATPTVPPTETPTPSPTTTPEPTATPTPTSTASPSPTATPSPTPSATATPTLTATATPTSTPDPTPSSTATPAPTPGPTQTPASTPSPAATPGPTGTPGSTAAPSPAAPATATAPVASTTPEALPPPAPAATPTAVSVALPATPVFIAGPEGLPVALNLPPAAVVSAPPTFATAPLAPAPSPTAPTATTPVATRTPTPGPTPTPSATPTHTPAPALSSAPPTPQADNAARSVFVRDFPAFNQLSTSPAVLLTNAALSLLALMLILLACSVFNATLEENGSELASVITRLVAPFGLSLAWLRGPDDDADGQRPISFWRLALILLAVAAIYAGLDPDFGWNASTAALVISLTVGVGLLTVVYEGAQVVLGSRAGGVHSSLQLQPLGIVIAALSVILTRVTNIHPGIVLGVIAGAAVGSHDAKLQGRIVTAAMLGILGLSLGALLLVDPFQTLSSTHASAWWAVIPETVVVTLFVGGIEGLLFSLLPLKFMEGRRVWDWSRPVWFILALAASFLFFHVVLNRTDAYTSVVEETGVQALLVICVLSIAVASVFWLACRLWLPGEAQPEVA